MDKEIIKSKLNRLLSWEGGQRLFNFAYSIGAAIVIWGALFKILHLPGGNALLCIGMGTEVVMFIITAFDRPPKEYHWEDVFPELDKRSLEYDEEGNPIAPAPLARGNMQGGVVIAGGGSAADSQAVVVKDSSPLHLSDEDSQAISDSIASMTEAARQLSKMAELSNATTAYLEQMQAIAAQMQTLHATTEALNQVSSTLLASYTAITEHSADIAANSTGYINQMNDLNRNIGGLNTIYEIQLKSVASQLDAIDRVNRGIKDIRDMYEKSAAQSARYCEETDKMARNMQQLNQVYEKMISAMTVNMYRPGAMPPAAE
ncbi:MAG: gliding motility protein GldL [Duncaniella sp.]|nr:gliding motility protein GldL [Duncaniella sp.]